MKEENWERQLIKDKIRGYNKDLDFYIDGYYSNNGLPHNGNPCAEIELPKEKNRKRLLIRRAA